MRVIVFGGTTEGRILSNRLADMGADVTVCVATPYGAEEQGERPGLTVRTGRLDRDAMARTVLGTALCIDATHPYAAEASKNIRAACEQAGVKHLRLLREESGVPADAAVFDTARDAAAYLQYTEGNILLATGAKELPVFADLGGWRLYPRVLPLPESIQSCRAAGIPTRNIIALQGPFTQELNEALVRQFRIRYLVTKDGGRAGGFAEKVSAAAAAGAELIVIRRPEEDGMDCETVLKQCREMME